MRSCFVVVVLAAARGASADPIDAALARLAQPIRLDAGKLAGKGADTLRPALDTAQFVMLGEDHGIAQIPQLAAAMCAELAPHGFHHLALEVGPSVGPELEQFARAPDGVARAAAFDRANPETVAFYNWKEELEFLRACAKSSTAPLQIWGVDQELMGAPVHVLREILATKPGPAGTAAIDALIAEDAADHAGATRSGDYGALFMMKATQSTFDGAKDALARDGSPEAQALFGSLLASRDIYLGQGGSTPYLSNRARARLMKGTFLDDLSAAAKAEHELPKVMLKLGAYHLYRGFNPLHSSELGNMIGEAAEGHKVLAVNVLVLGLEGQQLRPAGVGKRAAPGALDLRADPDWKFAAPLFAATRKTGWTLFELRALRPRFRDLGAIAPELERLIFGYDFVIVIPDPRPEHPL